MHARGHIDDKTIEYLTPEDPKPGRFYLLPKIHKQNNPGGPIVSANGHPTEKISEFIDFHLRPFVDSWFRFIDDVDMKWIHSDKELDEFFEYANSIHPSIKFTHEVSKTKMYFLDTTTTVKEGNIQLIYTLNPQTNINTFHPVVAILRTVLRVSHSAKPLGLW